MADPAVEIGGRRSRRIELEDVGSLGTPGGLLRAASPSVLFHTTQETSSSRQISEMRRSGQLEANGRPVSIGFPYIGSLSCACFETVLFAVSARAITIV